MRIEKKQRSLSGAGRHDQHQSETVLHGQIHVHDASPHRQGVFRALPEEIHDQEGASLSGDLPVHEKTGRTVPVQEEADPPGAEPEFQARFLGKGLEVQAMIMVSQ